MRTTFLICYLTFALVVSSELHMLQDRNIIALGEMIETFTLYSFRDKTITFGPWETEKYIHCTLYIFNTESTRKTILDAKKIKGDGFASFMGNSISFDASSSVYVNQRDNFYIAVNKNVAITVNNRLYSDALFKCNSSSLPIWLEEKVVPKP